MALESGERRSAARLQQLGIKQHEPDNLACPRCNSTDTKFCYYNNYNLSQPRHFCKSCRRYWTRGGTLRNVPVGGGTRKSSSSGKRARSAPASKTSSSSSSVSYEAVPGNPISFITGLKTEMASRAPLCAEVNLNDLAQTPGRGTGTFTSLLSSHPGYGFAPLDGFGSGFHGMDSGLGMWLWPMEQQIGGPNHGGGVDRGSSTGGSVSAGCSTWQIGCVDGGISDGDYFGWPELAISTPGNGLK